MKSPSAPLLILLAAIAASTINTGLAVTRPRSTSVAIPHQRKGDDYDNSFGLLVDKEGNLYFPSSMSSKTIGVASKSSSKRSSKTTFHRRATGLGSLRGGSNHATFRSCLRTDTEGNLYSPRRVSSSLRGGDLCVDNEGNLYTPREAADSATKALLTSAVVNPAVASSVSSPLEALRGGTSNKHQIGGLCVDSEGNLYAASSPSTTSSAILLLRGGRLCVDNEGNFYSPRPVAASTTSIKPQAPARRRRRTTSNADPNRILLAKNKLPKKTSTTSSSSSTTTKPKKPSAASNDNNNNNNNNNTLMET